MKNLLDICESAVKRYGRSAQVDKTIEAMGKLTAALSQFRRGQSTAETVREEIADVAIMAYQMAYIFGCRDVNAEIEYKLQKLDKQIKSSDK